MRKVVVLVVLAAGAFAFAALACGPGDDKPPLTPDTEHTDEAGAPAPAPTSK
jgi:hypothetical protein